MLNVNQIVSALTEERNRLSRAIAALTGTTETVQPTASGAIDRRGRRSFTAAQKAEQSRRMKAYWSKKNRSAKKY